MAVTLIQGLLRYVDLCSEAVLKTCDALAGIFREREIPYNAHAGTFHNFP